MKKKNHSAIYWVAVVLGIEAILVGVLFAFGFKITYAPELENNWTAIASIGTCIGAIITAFAVISAIRSNKTAMDANEISNKQFIEMVYQREQAERPYIEVSFEFDKFLCFVVSNEGMQSARNVKLRFNKEFIDMVKDDDFKMHIENLNKSSIFIAPKQKHLIYFGACGDEVAKSGNVEISCLYEGKGRTYEDTFHFNMLNYQGMFKIIEPLDIIAKSFKDFTFKDHQNELHQLNQTILASLETLNAKYADFNRPQASADIKNGNGVSKEDNHNG